MQTELRRLSVQDGMDVYQMMQALPESENGFQHSASQTSFGMFQSWLQKCHAQSRQTGVTAEGKVPQTVYWFYVDGVPVGLGKLRHCLTDELAERGGHIGYAIAPSYRGKGYGKALFQALLEEARRMQLPSVLATVNKDNVPSIRVMNACGGSFERMNDKYYYFWFDLNEKAREGEVTVSPLRTDEDIGSYVCLFEERAPACEADVGRRVSMEMLYRLTRPCETGQYIARIGRRAVGCVSCLARNEDDDFDRAEIHGSSLGDVGEVLHIHVRADVRRRGIGHMLLQTAMKELEQQGILTAWIPEMDLSAQRLFASFGFTADGAWQNNDDGTCKFTSIRMVLNKGFPVRISRRKLYQSDWVSLYRDRVRMPSGEIRPAYHRIHYDHPSVVVVILNEKDEILMIRSRRYTTGRFEWEVPAGRVEENESIADAVRRECEEETGCTLKELRELFCHNPANGMSDLLMYVYCARVDTEGVISDTDEVRDQCWMTRQQVEALLQSGDMHCGASMTALLYVLHYHIQS